VLLRRLPKLNRRTTLLPPRRVRNVQVRAAAEDGVEPPLRNPAGHEPVDVRARHDRVARRALLEGEDADRRARLARHELHPRLARQGELALRRGEDEAARHAHARVVDVVLEVAVYDGQVPTIAGAVV